MNDFPTFLVLLTPRTSTRTFPLTSVPQPRGPRVPATSTQRARAGEGHRSAPVTSEIRPTPPHPARGLRDCPIPSPRGDQPKPRCPVLTRGPCQVVRSRAGLFPPGRRSARSPTPGCIAEQPSGLGNSVAGSRGPPCHEPQFPQAVGRAARTGRCGGSNMAAAVRAAGRLPALCGAPVGESGNADGDCCEWGGGSPRRRKAGSRARTLGPSRRAPSPVLICPVTLRAQAFVRQSEGGLGGWFSRPARARRRGAGNRKPASPSRRA